MAACCDDEGTPIIVGDDIAASSESEIKYPYKLGWRSATDHHTKSMEL